MSDSFRLTGGYTVTPQSAPLSFAQTAEATIDESVTLSAKTTTDVLLTVDTPVAVNFGGVTVANVVILKAVGGKVTARLTSADGTSQSVPFDTYLILMNDAVPITAIDLTRVAGTSTIVRVFLGDKA